ncbi:hypothetical protein D3C71_1340440 [compost metagenome]
MAEAEHAVAAGVVQDRALEGHHPGTAGGQGHVRGHRIVGIEIDEPILHRIDLGAFVQRQQRAQLGAHALEFGGGSVDRSDQLRVAGGQAFQAGVIQAGGEAGAGLGAKGGKTFDEAHCRSPETIGGTAEMQNARLFARARGIPARASDFHPDASTRLFAR